MRKMIALLAVAAMVAVLAVPVAALAAGNSESSAQKQESCTGGLDVPPGDGDCLSTRDCLREGPCEGCTAECDDDQTCTRTQTQTQTQAEIKDDALEPVDAKVKAQVKAGALRESSGEPGEKPVAATVRAETQEDEGFFGGIIVGLQRIAQRLMDLLGLA
ncbi:MAG: hypothetical protein U1F44_06150 [Coriobacteriia bacterium]|nr:hypothetical protein [Coriobacteriia bacterium]